MGITTIQMKRGSSEVWESLNPVLLSGELGLETDSGRFKFGDGISEWTELGYAVLSLPPADGKVYVMKNGEWAEALLAEQPSEWQPEIDGSEDIVLTLDEDMQPYQLTGVNV